MTYEICVVLTDSAQRYFDPNDKSKKEIVQLSNIPSDQMDEYSPCGFLFIKGNEDDFGITTEKITGDAKNVEIEGFQKVSIIPIPSNQTISIGDTMTHNTFYSLSSDGSIMDSASVKVISIILMKNKNDVEPLMNEMLKLESQFGRKIMMAEEVMNNDGLLLEAESEDFSAEEYDTFLTELGLEKLPTHRFYKANV